MNPEILSFVAAALPTPPLLPSCACRLPRSLPTLAYLAWPGLAWRHARMLRKPPSPGFDAGAVSRRGRGAPPVQPRGSPRDPLCALRDPHARRASDPASVASARASARHPPRSPSCAGRRTRRTGHCACALQWSSLALRMRSLRALERGALAYRIRSVYALGDVTTPTRLASLRQYVTSFSPWGFF